MTPDFEKAASMALRVLIENDVRKAPIDPFPFLKNRSDVMMISFEEMSESLNKDRMNIIRSCKHSPDAVTAFNVDGDEIKYIVAYNRYLSINILQKAFARELAHVILGHDGSLPDDIRAAEAQCFAQHLLFPRPLIHSIQATGIRLTTHVLGSITACNKECVQCMRKLPAIHVDPSLNRQVRDMFQHYVINYFEYQRILCKDDITSVVDLGTYMEGYAE